MKEGGPTWRERWLRGKICKATRREAESPGGWRAEEVQL